MKSESSVVALAGRRVDASGAQPLRFPEASVEHVKAHLRVALLGTLRTLVCSAAAGADLLALGIAGEYGIRRRVILPFDKFSFRQSSVADRPGSWLADYDKSIAEIEQARDLIVLGLDPGDPDAYSRTNIEILNEACRLAEEDKSTACAFVVWDGNARGEEDFTLHFLNEALARNMRVTEIPTLQ